MKLYKIIKKLIFSFTFIEEGFLWKVLKNFALAFTFLKENRMSKVYVKTSHYEESY